MIFITNILVWMQFFINIVISKLSRYTSVGARVFVLDQTLDFVQKYRVNLDTETFKNWPRFYDLV